MAEPLRKVTEPPVLETGLVMESVLASALVDFKVQVETPLPFVAEHAPRVLELPVAEKLGVAPDTGFEFASRRVIVTVEALDPSAVILLVPVMEELAATAEVATKVTVVVTLPNPAGVAMESVFVPVTVEEIVPVACPEAFVVLTGCVRVFPVPVAAKVTVWEGTGLL